MYLVDTNILSETRRPIQGERKVLDWLDAVGSHDLYLSAITDYELEVGVLAKERRHPGGARRHRGWLSGVRQEFGRRTLPVTPEIARICARINVPDRRPLADSLIAATALHHGFTVVTRDVRDFDVPGLAVIDPSA